METKEFTQFGTLTVVIMSVLLIVLAVFLLVPGFLPDQQTYLYALIGLSLLVCIILFYKMTITIDNERISFKMGIGLLGKSYKISDIRNCRSVTNSFVYGWGIHLIPRGWLYNISGSKAIELTFNNSGKVVRLGTNKPEEIVEIMQKLIK